MPRRILIACFVGGLLLAGIHGHAAPADPAQKPLWKPVKDTVFLQEVGSQVATKAPVLSVAVLGNQVFAGQDTGARVLRGGALVDCGGAAVPVHRMKALGDALYIVTDKALHRLRDGKWTKLSDGKYEDLCLHLGEVCVATSNNVYRLDGDVLTDIDHANKNAHGITHLASYSESLYVLGQGRLAVLDPIRGGFDPINVADWGALPSQATRDMLVRGSRLFVATDAGLGQLRGMGMTVIRGEDGLCYEDTTCLAQGFGDDLWIGTTDGAIRNTDGEYHYFAGIRWLPDNRVNSIAAGKEVVYIATDAGIGIIEYEPFTLLKKAAYYERHLEEWGQKRLGFTHKLEWNEAKGGWVREVSDNDAGWSTHYLAAQCFKYAVTGDEDARKEAVYYFESLKWVEEISSIDGFPARSVWSKGETSNRATGGSGGYPAEWIPTPDGRWAWKADTSSDETDGHFYAVSIFHDLAAEGKEKEMAKEHLHRIATHIVDNGWVLRDLDGKPTRWARWDPEYFLTPGGFLARGLNGLGILCYIRTATVITGDPKFEKAYNQLLDMGYHKNLLRQKLVFPPDDIFHSDDRLAFYNYYSLLKYETDPALRSAYMRSFERSWEIERLEHIPWFNFIYGALTGNDCESGEAVKHLKEWPLDMIRHPYRNSQRHDLHTPKGYVPYAGGTRAISPREARPIRWCDTTLRLDGGGHSVMDPSGWLDAYWMGRFYGFIEAPETDDPALTTVPERGLQLGAIPYDGFPRPEPGTSAFRGQAEEKK